MKNYKKQSLILLLVCSLWGLGGFGGGCFAQGNFPVTSTPFFVPQYNLQWSNFYNSANFLKIMLTLKDNKTAGDLDVFLRIRLERVGIVIANRPDFIAQNPIRLRFGSPTTLTGVDIAENFLPQNLEVQGIDEAFIRQGGNLPDGLWTIKITAFEFDGVRGYRQVSNEGLGQTVVFLGQPPLLINPAENAEIDNSFGSNILFSWLPRATAGLGGLTGIAYNFQLFELGDEETSNEVALGKKAIYTTTVSNAFFLYDASKPPLIAGKRYAWRVQVEDAAGNNKYENEGFSAVSTFRYGLTCKAVKQPQISSIGGKFYRIAWERSANARSYELQWRRGMTKNGGNWTTESTFGLSVDMDLEDDYWYEFRVRGICNNGEISEWSEVVAFNDFRNPSKLANARMSITAGNTSLPNNTPINPADVPVSGGDLSGLEDLKTKLNKAPDYAKDRCGVTVINSPAGCVVPVTTRYTGTEPLTVINPATKLYLNGFEIVVTQGDAKEGQGLLFFPFLMKRIPVEWTNLTIMKGEAVDILEADYGCIVGPTDKVQVQGSDDTILKDDLERQFTDLATALNSPGEYSGTFGDALKKVKLVAQDLLNKIANGGPPPTKKDYQGFNSICKAIDKGIDAWKKSIEKEYGANSNVPEIKELLANIEGYKTELNSRLDCDGTGLLKPKSGLNENAIFYASSSNELRAIDFEPAFIVSNCKLDGTKILADLILKDLDVTNALKKNQIVNIPTVSVSFQVSGQTLTINHNATIGSTSKKNTYNYKFKDGIKLSLVAGNLVEIDGIKYMATSSVQSGIFRGLYRENYVSTTTEMPISLRLSVDGGEYKKMYENGFLDPNLYKKIYDLAPKNTLSSTGDVEAIKWLSTLPAGTKDRANFNATTVYIYVTTQASTASQREQVASDVNNTATDKISLWVDISGTPESPIFKYQFYYGSGITLGVSEKELIEKVFYEWALINAPPANYKDIPTLFPFIAIFEALGEFISYAKSNPEHWNCDSPTYKKPFHIHNDEDKKNHALFAGIWDGVVGQIAALPDIVATILNENKSLFNDLCAVLTTPVLLDSYKEKYTEIRNKPCELNYAIGHDFVDVGVLCYGAYELGASLSKSNLVEGLGKILKNSSSKELAQSLLKAALKGANNTFKVAKGSVKIVYQGGRTIISNIAGEVMIGIGDKISWLGSEYSLTSITAEGYVFTGPNKVQMIGKALLDNAENALVKFEKGKEEILVVVKRDYSALLKLKLGANFTTFENWINVNRSTLKFAGKTGEEAVEALLKELEVNLANEKVNIAKIDGNGRFVVQCEGVSAKKVFSILTKEDGTTIVRYYQNGYNPAKCSYGVELSDNLSAPDFSKGLNTNSWLYEVTGEQKNIVKIKMTGTRQNILNSDFELANQASKIPGLEIGKAPTGYTWHHLDDFNPITGECTMQLIKQEVHRTTFPHTGSPAQYTDFTGIQYK